MNDTCNTNESLATPAVYMAERPEGYDITFEIPGAGKGDVDLHVDGRTLRLRTTKKPAEKPAGFREAVREFDPDANFAVTVETRTSRSRSTCPSWRTPLRRRRRSRTASCASPSRSARRTSPAASRSGSRRPCAPRRGGVAHPATAASSTASGCAAEGCVVDSAA